MEQVSPDLSFGILPRELVDIRLDFSGGGLRVDLFPRADDMAEPAAYPGAVEKALQNVGAQKLSRSPEFLRLTFDYVDAFAYRGPDETFQALAWDEDWENYPKTGDQAWPYPLLRVTGSNWCENAIDGLIHFRVISPFHGLDILGYEPDAAWKIEGR